MSDVMSPDKQYDIVIVGAGLVGATFAARLVSLLESIEKNHLSIALLDAGDAPRLPNLDAESPEFDPRVVALTHASESLLDSLGVWDIVKQQRTCAYTDMVVWDGDGTASISFNAEDIHQHHLGHIVENSVLLQAVLNQLSDNITVIRDIKVTALKQQENNTLLYTENDNVFSARLVVAADGGQSKIRELAGFDTREWEYGHKAIVATVQSEQSHQRTAWQAFLPTGPLAFLPLSSSSKFHPSDQYCSIVWSLETDQADKKMALDDNAFVADLEAAFEKRLGKILSISRRFCFPLKQRHAVNYIKDNIVLIGDAAHTIHPLAGQGVNLGLLDVEALAQELARAIDRGLGVNEPATFRRYERERKKDNLQTMLLMEAFKQLFGSRDVTMRFLRNAGLKAVNEMTLLKNWMARGAVKNRI